MNVLIISQYFPPDFGGAGTRSYNAARGLIKQDCDVTVISAFPHYPHGNIPKKYARKLRVLEECDGIKLIRTWVPNIPHSSIAKRILIHMSFMISSLFALSLVKKVDIIFAMNPNIFSFFPALFYKILYRKDIIRNVDDLWPEVFYEMGIVKSRIIKKILDSLASLSYTIPIAIIPVSQGYVKTIVTKYHIPQKKIFVIEHGVDTTKFEKVKVEQTKKNQVTTVMYSGVLGPGYDFEIVIKCAKVLESEPIHFVIRGIGELENSIKQMIEKYGVKNVKVRTGLLSKNELIALMKKTDIFLLPMASGIVDQGFPTKILEYQAAGKPIVCISNGESRNYILKTESGLVTSSRQPEELARLILTLVRDRKLAKRLGTNGFNNIRNNLTLDLVGKRLMNIIKSHNIQTNLK